MTLKKTLSPTIAHFSEPITSSFLEYSDEERVQPEFGCVGNDMLFKAISFNLRRDLCRVETDLCEVEIPHLSQQ